tara:strand:+ start:776 stop:1060 length:285 start_codon:yes stop_codon:yes gene_type:complete
VAIANNIESKQEDKSTSRCAFFTLLQINFFKKQYVILLPGVRGSEREPGRRTLDFSNFLNTVVKTLGVLVSIESILENIACTSLYTDHRPVLLI